MTDQSNTCEFADGPLQGSLDLAVRIEEAPLLIAFPVMQDLKPFKGKGVPSGVVEYEKRHHNGKWKYFHVKTEISPEVGQEYYKLVENAKAHGILSEFTHEQLIRELAARKEFVGAIVYVLDDVSGKTIPAGSNIGLVHSTFFESPQSAAKLLEVGLATINGQIGDSERKRNPTSDSPRPMTIDGMTTLPLYSVMARSLEAIPQFGKGKVRIEYVDPGYEPMQYPLEVVGERISNDSRFAIAVVRKWPEHLSKYLYFVQFRDDKSRKLIRALYDHTETVTTLCDTRLSIDPTEIWSAFDSVITFEGIHSDYRADDDRDARYADYASRLEAAHDRHSQHSMRAMRLIARIAKQIELKAAIWQDLVSLLISQRKSRAITSSSNMNPSQSPVPLKLFYSYSSHDEELRKELEKHLSALQRTGVIEDWHFRKIVAGREWEGEIDQNLERADIILLLLSADFLFSNYCWEIEGRRAMERHQKNECTVIPVVLRACDWGETPFHKLQGLPKDGLPVTSWDNRDEAFTDVAKGIKTAAKLMRAR